MRSMWKGPISFGLVSVPVRLFKATEAKDSSFRQVRASDGSRIKFVRVAVADGAEVPYSEVARGVERADGEMVVLTDEDMATLPLSSARSITVEKFVEESQVDPLLFDGHYYAEPEAGGLRAYQLLREAMRREGKVAIAKVALRQRESLAVLRPVGDVLTLTLLLWPAEVRQPVFGFQNEATALSEAEVEMASQLIGAMASDFDPEDYHDEYADALAALVAAKAEGAAVPAPAVAPKAPAAPDLAAVLAASLAAQKAEAKAKARAKAPAPRRARKSA